MQDQLIIPVSAFFPLKIFKTVTFAFSRNSVPAESNDTPKLIYQSLFEENQRTKVNPYSRLYLGSIRPTFVSLRSHERVRTCLTALCNYCGAIIELFGVDE